MCSNDEGTGVGIVAQEIETGKVFGYACVISEKKISTIAGETLAHKLGVQIANNLGLSVNCYYGDNNRIKAEKDIMLKSITAKESSLMHLADCLSRFGRKRYIDLEVWNRYVVSPNGHGNPQWRKLGREKMF